MRKTKYNEVLVDVTMGDGWEFKIDKCLKCGIEDKVTSPDAAPSVIPCGDYTCDAEYSIVKNDDYERLFEIAKSFQDKHKPITSHNIKYRLVQDES